MTVYRKHNFRTSGTGTCTANKFDDDVSVMHFLDFNSGILGKTAPPRSFVENDDDAKLVLN